FVSGQRQSMYPRLNGPCTTLMPRSQQRPSHTSGVAVCKSPGRDEGDSELRRPLPPDMFAAANQAASEVRSVDFRRAGLPPGGFRGEWSRLDSASRISSMEMVRFTPGMARSDGHDVTAAASDAQDARIARFSA